LKGGLKNWIQHSQVWTREPRQLPCPQHRLMSTAIKIYLRMMKKTTSWRKPTKMPLFQNVLTYPDKLRHCSHRPVTGSQSLEFCPRYEPLNPQTGISTYSIKPNSKHTFSICPVGGTAFFEGSCPPANTLVSQKAVQSAHEPQLRFFHIVSLSFLQYLCNVLFP
jgi:hypothetical protein